MAIIETKETYFYELDWYVPDVSVKKVYIAIKGTIEKNTVLPIMLDGIGYSWEEDETSKIKLISKQDFLNKATPENIVYFFEPHNYNYLLNYPRKLQSVIDKGLLDMGIKPHKVVSVRDQLYLLKVKSKNKRTSQEIQKLFKKEEGRDL